MDPLQYFRQQAALIDRVMRQDLETVADPDLGRVLDGALFTGGKRIRPMLNLLAAAAVRGCPVEELPPAHFDLAIAFEYLHVASLVHDDIIDSSDTRRGHPAVWRAHSRAAAILAGDYLHARAMTLAGTAGGREVLGVIGRATCAMVESEFLQMRVAGDTACGEEDYLAVLRGKTAALIAAACETGVILAGGNRRQREEMSAYGASLGLAFQMRDDLLDYLGDPAVTGKRVGNDFLEAKMTMPVIFAMARAGDEARKELSAMLAADRGRREAGFEAACGIIEEAGGFSLTAERAGELVARAVDALSGFPGRAAADVLAGLAAYAVERDR